MITVHHLADSRSQRILWLLEELGVAYEVKRYERDTRTLRAPRALCDVHPLGKSPVLTDGDLTIAETGAILDHLVETYGGGRLVPPPGSADGRRYRHFVHHAEGSAMPPLVMKLVFGRIAKAAPFVLRPLMKAMFAKVDQTFLDPQLRRLADYWEAELGPTGWFAGSDLTGADIMMSFPLETAATRAGFGTRPHCSAFLTRIHARPAYKAALGRGGAYAYA